MKKVLFFYIVLCTIGCFGKNSFAQTPQEQIAKMMKSQLGDDCKIIDENGKEITIEFAAEQTLGFSMLGKRINYVPIKMVNGKKLIMKFLAIDASEVKPLLSKIDFTNTSLGFYDIDKKKLTADEFKTTLEANAELIASYYNVDNGVVADFIITAKKKPQQLAINSNDMGKGAGTNMSGSSMANATNSNNVLKVGEKMPAFKAFDINGKEWNSVDLENKIVVLNFWFVECKPCVAEMSALNKLVAKYKNNTDLVFLSIAMSDKDKVQKFLQTKPFNYAHIAQEEAIKYLDSWGVSAFPLNLVVNKSKIVFSFAGGTAYADDTILNTLSEQIESCLK